MSRGRGFAPRNPREVLFVVLFSSISIHTSSS
nr:MAG TPA: hypothetical protein [Caudoviricetes sp.]